MDDPLFRTHISVTLRLLRALLVVILTSSLVNDFTISSAKSTDVDERELRPVNFYLTGEDQQVVLYKLICRGWPCPKFKVEKDWTPFTQERIYDAYTTAAITLSGCGNFSDYLLEGYMALFRYRHGNNAEKKTITMSMPVLTEVQPDLASNEVCDTKYTVNFYVNKEGKLDGVPKPNEENITLQVLPNNMDVYVKTYVGFVDEFVSKWIEMKVDLDTLGLCYNPDRYFIANYDPPWKKHGRRNEIWALAIPCEERSRLLIR